MSATCALIKNKFSHFILFLSIGFEIFIHLTPNLIEDIDRDVMQVSNILIYKIVFVQSKLFYESPVGKYACICI